MGRPKKTREHLEAKAKQDLFDGNLDSIALVVGLARLANAQMESALAKPTKANIKRLKELDIVPKAVLENAWKLIEHEHGRARQMMEHTGGNGEPITIKVVYDNGNKGTNGTPANPAP